MPSTMYPQGGLLSEAMFVKWGSEGYLEIRKQEIVNVEAGKGFLAKKAILTPGGRFKACVQLRNAKHR